MLYRGGFIHFYIAIICRIGINVLLSIQLGSQMGLMGIGLASILSLLIALLVKLTFLFSKKHGLKFVWYLNPKEALRVAKLGFPESAISIFVVIMEFGINSFTLKNYGAAGVASVSVVINIFEFTFYLSEGISEFELVSVNDSIGKNSSRCMDLSIKKTLRAALMEGALLMGLIFLASSLLPEAFDIDNAKTAALTSLMLKIFAPTAIFICLTRITAIFYQYTERLPRTITILGLAIAIFPIAFGMLLGQTSEVGIVVGMTLGPTMAFTLMYLFVRLIKREKLFDYTLMHLD